MSEKTEEPAAEQKPTRPSSELDDKATVTAPASEKTTVHNAELNDDATQYPSGPKLALITFGLCLASFMVRCSLKRDKISVLRSLSTTQSLVCATTFSNMSSNPS